MAIKYRQALGAAIELLRDPFDFPPAVRLCDAMADFWLVKRLYARILDGLPAEVAAHLYELTLRPIDLDALARMPEATFGRRYAAFLAAHKVSASAQVDAFPEIAKTFERHWILRRFARIHDMHHALLGFGVDAHGEMGLQMFNLRNFGEPYGALAMASFPVTALKYGEPRRMLREIAKGWTMGGRAANLFVVPFEDRFDADFAELRRELGLAENEPR